MMSISLATPAQDIAHARSLMRRYAQCSGANLCFQNFEAELAELAAKYVAPDGALSLANFEHSAEPAGVIALRPLDGTVCEIKRLWVEPAAQGQGLGGKLARSAINLARASGYAEMKLDTLRERMPIAIALYRSLGFVETTRCTLNPEPDVLFMRLNLRAESP